MVKHFAYGDAINVALMDAKTDDATRHTYVATTSGLLRLESNKT